MNTSDAQLVADTIRFARVQWHLGLAQRPPTVDEPGLARIEHRLRAQVANVRHVPPITGLMAEEWVTVAEGSMRTGVPRRTLTRWVGDGRVRSRKVGTSSRAPHLIALDDIEQQLERRTA